MKMNRRDFLKATAVGSMAAGFATFPYIAKGAGKKVIVIGGGAGGTIAAKYLKKMDNSLDVTLIERNPDYYTCFMSNEVIGGERKLESIKFNYERLKKHGINVVIGEVSGGDLNAKTIKVGDKSLNYDKLIVSPGVDMKWGAIEGYDEAASQKMPHAWKAGDQTALLRKQLEAMQDGGVVLIAAPANPFRCPPGPYERASLVAQYLKAHKPKSKVIILDAKDDFAKKGLFEQGWKELYGYGTDKSLIEWRSAANQGKVSRVDAAKNAVYAGEMGDEIVGAVVNVIPPQKAGQIATVLGLTNDAGWCPVNRKTFESAQAKDVHVIGDACIADAMPKSAYSANSQAKVCAAAVVAALQGKDMVTPAYTNTCYSMVGPDYGISVAAVYNYKAEDNSIAPVQGAGGVSAKDASAEDRKREMLYGHSWFNNIVEDMFG